MEREELMKISSRQRGQVLVIVAIALITLLGMVGLAVDGSNAFATRRQSQAAADAAAYAAALEYSTKGISSPGNSTPLAEAQNKATLNSHSITGAKNGQCTGSWTCMAVTAFLPL